MKPIPKAASHAQRFKRKTLQIARDVVEEEHTIAVARKIARATGRLVFITESSGDIICVVPSHDDGRLQKILRENFSIQELKQLIADIEAKMTRKLH